MNTFYQFASKYGISITVADEKKFLSSRTEPAQSRNKNKNN